MEKKFDVIIVPSLQAEIDKIRDGKQLELIQKSFEKIQRMGKNSLKVLHVRNQYLLTEIKFKRPPYRLYVIVDQLEEKFYMVRWDHKNKQQRVIDDLKRRLGLVFERGIKNILDLFNR